MTGLTGNNAITGAGYRKNQPPYEIDQSLRFEDGGPAYLSRTPSSAGNRKTWTWSSWVKRGNSGAHQNIFVFGAANTDQVTLAINSSDKLSFSVIHSNTTTVEYVTTQVFRDPSAWYHIVVSGDTTPASPLFKVYVNGEQVTAFDTSTNSAAQDGEYAANNTVVHRIGERAFSSSQPFDGYLAEVHWIDGQALTPASFGDTVASTNQWLPIEYVGSYGTNGFYEKFSSTELANSFTNDTYSDAFVPSSNLTVNYLVVAGGASGGAGNKHNYGGGGGGAGGLLSGSTSVTSGTSYPITIGAGGAAIAPSNGSGAAGNNGSNSVFSSFTAIGGGGGSHASTAAKDGGSGGGGAGGSASGGDGTSGQGNDGGDADNYLGAGGGGAGGAGATRSGTTGGAGGAGADHSGTFGTGYGASGLFAGGGGGGYVTYGGQGDTAGPGGSGGGGASGATDGTSGATTQGVAGTASTGSGGGGGSSYHSGSTSTSSGGSGAGGSGVVLIRYAGSSPQATGGTISTVNISGTDYQVHAFTNVYTDHTITANGDVANTRAQEKIGTSSIYFDGTGDYLNVGNSTDWDFGSGDFTLECWARASALPDQPRLFGDSGGNWFFRIGDSSGDKVISAYNGNWFGDDQHGVVAVNTWYHFAWSRASGTNRFFFDGQLITDSTITNASISTTNLYIGGGVSSQDLDGYMDEIRISNSARYTANFTPSTTAFTADANTLLLIHSDFNGGLGADSSGNENDFAPTNLVATDQVLDSPTNNFATLNPLWNKAGGYSFTLSEGNLKNTVGTGGQTIPSTFIAAPLDKKWYWEWYGISGGANKGIGVILNLEAATSYENQSAYQWKWEGTNGIMYNTGGSSSYTLANSTLLETGDVGAIFIDGADIKFYKNGSLTYTATNAITAANSNCIIPSSGGYHDNNVYAMNFGQDSSFAGEKTSGSANASDANGIGDFYHTPPTGALACCSDNLPDPSIADPTAHFNTVLYTGNNGSNQSVTGVGFQPDFLWIKPRDYADNHGLIDSVRGGNYNLWSNSTSAEQDNTGGNDAVTLDSDGFTVNQFSNSWNRNGYLFVGWNWKAGGAASTNEEGSLDSSVSANPTAGFSVLTYTGNATAGATVGHGLSQAPELVINKVRGSATQWYVNATAVSDTSNKVLMLNGTDALDSGTLYFNDTDPTATLITLGSYGNLNSTGSNVIYCWHSVEGYSKIGTYTGNASTNGPFIYTGFRPAWIILKNATSGGGGKSWVINDSKRVGYNADNPRLRADTSGIEDDTGRLDIFSNGFKLTQTYAEANESGQTFLYMAFAESPQKFSNAR